MKVWHLIVAGVAGMFLASGCSKGETSSVQTQQSAQAPKKDTGTNTDKAEEKQPKKEAVTPKEVKTMEVKAPWANGTDIPMKYVHSNKGGQNVSPAVSWTKVDGAVQYLVVMVDHHPVARDWLHWVAAVPGSVTELAEGASGNDKNLREFANTWGNARYEGPAAPKGTGRHDYHIVVFALSKEISLPPKPTWAAIEQAVKPMLLGRGEVVGYYETK